MSKLDPQVFRRAAANILSGRHDYCCPAIKWITGGGMEYNHFLASLFKPRGHGIDEPWWTMFDDDRENTWECRREARILALLLCAEMCKQAEGGGE